MRMLNCGYILSYPLQQLLVRRHISLTDRLITDLPVLVPGWLTNSVWSKSQLTSIIQDYVATVTGHYRGQVYAWDVVSEIFEDNGKWRSNVFYDVLGPDYVQIALVAARSADPGAKLYIEEYGAEEVNVKSDALFSLTQDLKNNGVPLDGIGFEGHSVTPQIPTPYSVMVNTQRFEALDLDWAYTRKFVGHSEHS
ncbi:hypothetical protein FRC04_002229 [Tulasnella sp. 424]|nr:hypothetical protein FRC04_002229 [Tulasnella sp. 424]